MKKVKAKDMVEGRCYRYERLLACEPNLEGGIVYKIKNKYYYIENDGIKTECSKPFESTTLYHIPRNTFKLED